MIYFATGNDPGLIRALERRDDMGIITTPNVGNRLDAYPPDTLLIADNGCFSDRWDSAAWSTWLRTVPPDRTLFAVVPDVVGDHRATLARWDEWVDGVRDLGHRPAFVLQDGCSGVDELPEDADALFVGGTDAYKLGPEAAAITRSESSRRWCHMGRVNSLRRIVRAASTGCHSVDGTYVSHGPRVNLPTVCGWLNRVHEPPLPLEVLS